MHRSATSLLLVITLGLAHASWQPATAADRPQAPNQLQRPLGEILHGGPAGAAKSSRDTVVVFGGPDTLDGKFENVFGSPDQQGWTGVDYSADDVIYWHPDTFHAADLDPDTPDNHAWWCGTIFEPCGPEDPEEGYGNSWEQVLTWQGQVADPTQPVAVTVTATMAWDTEPGYDFIMLEVAGGDGYQTVWSDDYQRVFYEFAETFTVPAADFGGDQGDEVHLRWRFTSDGAWSDEDCLWPTQFGGAQIDLITVSFDQGDGPVQIGPTETAEPGAPSTWTAELPPSVGDYTQIWADLADIDPCFDDDTPVLAFIDDGLIVPGTGGSHCVSWCYGPDGYVVNHTGGLAGEDYRIFNVAWSEAIALPGDPATGAALAFDVYEHNGFVIQNTAEIFWVWYVDSTDDPTGKAGWSGRRNRNFLREGGPGWRRMDVPVGDLLVPDARWVRLGLGVYQHFFSWTPGNESTPAPYFDNVRLSLHEAGGPAITMSSLNLAQDAYPTSGTIDPDDLGAASVRFDSARDISTSAPALVAGDSLIATVDRRGEDGSMLQGPARLHYRLFRNPVFDAYRTSGLPDLGHADGDTIFANIYRMVYSFDLPDEGFLFPGDRLHYYIVAGEESGGVVRTTILPADTTGFGNGDLEAYLAGPVYDHRFTFRALPNLRSADPADRPALLVWDRSDNAETRRAWQQSLGHLGLREGQDYDLFVTQNPDQDQVNSLGRLCSDELLAGYETILVESGARRYTFLGPMLSSFQPNPAPDTDALAAWLELGDRALFVAGDRVPANLDLADAQFLADYIGGQPEGQGNFEEDLGGQVAPPVLVAAGAPWPTGLAGWIATGCRANRSFRRGWVSSMVPTAAGAVPLAVYGTPDHDPDVYPYAALLLNELQPTGSRVVTLAHSLVRVVSGRDQDSPGSPLPARTLLLGEVLAALGQEPGSPPVPAPDTPRSLSLAAYPNPFNPAVTLSLSVPRTGHVDVAVFDLRGRRVRTLMDARHEAGRLSLTWDATDDDGRAVGAGVYLARVIAGDEQQLVKLALVK